jgi:hypothetical protein
VRVQPRNRYTATTSATATRKLTTRAWLSNIGPISQELRDSGVRMPVGVEPRTTSPPFYRISDKPRVTKAPTSWS